jgi:hypothetical protein
VELKRQLHFQVVGGGNLAVIDSGQSIEKEIT